MPKDMSTAPDESMAPDETAIPEPTSVTFRKPVPEDGSEIWNLIRECKPLDENSMYCNLIQADHFADTCVVAEVDGEILGWISGHMIPNDDSFFVWQVAVSPRARGLGLGKRMLQELIDRDECAEARHMKTTITKSNDASWGLFRSFAKSIGGEIEDEPHFEEDVHFDGSAPTEHMVSISIPRSGDNLRVVA